MVKKIALTIAAFIFLLSLMSFAPPKEPNYIGAKKCKTCHNAKKNGAQFKIWSANKHAEAYAALKTESAKTKAKAAGVEDPLTSENCLGCHATASGKKNVAKSYKVDEGVGCESCHGPGSEYKSMKVMKDREASVAGGLLIPDEKTCASCHKKDTPGHKGKFTNFKDEFKKIAHPVPAETDRRKKKS